MEYEEDYYKFMFYDGAGFCFCRVYRLFGFRLYFDERITIEDVFKIKITLMNG